MAVYDHEEQEQLDELKAWWKQHGNKVVNVALAVSLVAAMAVGWRWWQGKQSAEAAGLYSQLQLSLEKRDTKRTLDIAVELADRYASTPYAGMAALLAARSQYEAGDLKNARAQLAWAADKAGDPALRDLAHLRLAGVLLEEKSYDEALAQVAKPAESAFAARFAEVRGDIYAAQGKRSEAREAYAAALAALTEAKAGEATISPLEQRMAAYRELVEIKLETVGGKS